MAEYTLEAPLKFKEGTGIADIPAGATVEVVWSILGTGPHTVRYGSTEVRVSGKGIGRAIAGGLPTMEELEYWTYDSVCPNPMDVDVEPDGRDEDGCPSWLSLLGYV